VLINPAYQRRIEALAQTTVAPPMGLMYLAGALQRDGHNVAIVDANAHGWTPANIIGDGTWRGADLIGITATTPTIHVAYQIATTLRIAGYGGVIGVGGPHVTALPEGTLNDCKALDFGAIGEAESTLIEVMEALEEGSPLTTIAGLVVRTDDKVVQTGPRHAPDNVDTLAPPARHLVDDDLYISPDGRRFAVVVASRGCPAPCTYCQVPRMFGRITRRRNPVAIADEVQQLADQGVTFIDFIDDTFSWSRRWVLQLCHEFRQRKLHERVKWLCLTRVDRVSPDLFEAMAAAGCVRVEMGIECASSDGLDALKKGIDITHVTHAFKWARDAGIETLAFAMINVPGESLRDIRRTERLLKRVEPDYLQLTICTPYPGTALYTRARAEGRLRTDSFADYRFMREVVLDNGVLTPKEVKKAWRDVQRRFWLRPKRVAHVVKRAVSDAGPVATVRMIGKAAEQLL